MKYVVVGTAVVIALGWLIADQRHALLYYGAKITLGSPPPLVDAVRELPTTTWFDDYYTIDEIAPGTYAIGEPRYYQQNFNYLVVGETQALLFDAGPGVRDIRPVVESLTDLPIIFLPSHFHYDHVGNGIEFGRRAVVDLPYLRDRSVGDRLAFTKMEHLGPVEGFSIPTWQIDYWWPPGHEVDLGARKVSIIHTPGHSKESISIFDAANDIILSGDFLYPGMLYIFVPGASMQDYLETTQTLLSTHAEAVVYYGAHRITPPGPPALTRQDLSDLQNTLLQLRSGDADGSGTWPRSFRVNNRITILGDPGFLQDWD